MVSATAAHGNYTPDYYAQRALDYLVERRGLAQFVRKTYHDERTAFSEGDRIKIRQPGSVAVKDETDLAFETLAARDVELVLDKFKHASFEVKDWDAAYSGEKLLMEHIFPAVDGVAEQIDRDLHGLSTSVGPYHTVGGTPGVSDVTGPLQKLMRNKCPITQTENMFFVCGPQLWADFLNVSAFTQWQGSGSTGEAAQVGGQIGQRFGFNFLPSTIVPSHTAGAGITASAPKMQGAKTVGTTSFTIDDTSLTGAVAAGDIITITHTDGTTRDYAIASAATAASNAVAIVITRGLIKAVADNAVCSFVTASKIENIAMHRNALGFAMAPLPQTADHAASANVATATDPQTQLSIRVAKQWDISSRKMLVAVDALYGVTVLDDSLACRVRS